MLVLSNRRLGPTAEIAVVRDVAVAVLAEVADAARESATAQWELELVRWLDEHARAIATTHAGHRMIDVGDIAFTPQHFDRQRRFLVDAIARAGTRSAHSRALLAWGALIEAHPSDSVQFGRRWMWHSTH